jgi:hypothetical protein
VLDNSLLPLDASVPTFFANPFRSPDAASLVPLNNLHRPETESTILRRQAFNPGRDGAWGRVNANDSGGDPNILDDLGEFGADRRRDDILDEDPAFGSSFADEFNHAGRNPFFRYQPVSRLSSMTTSRSNVYAVWVTIGFFEVQEAPLEADFANENGLAPGSPESLALYERVYPEGYQFGQEAGIDTGNIVRIREFAMIDRTVPVAFEPGKNHNVEKAIRLKRRIE